ncbi:glycosyltransferase family 61 protein [Lacibacter luteus]|nr:glycosyltransferase family 61 protein [Lacibacter luteus]
MPVNFKTGDFDFCKDEFYYQTNYVTASSYTNVLVSDAGLVYDSSLKIIPVSKVDAKQANRFKNIKQLVFRPKKRMPDVAYALCFDGRTSNHYHWICDFLPRLYAAKHMFGTHVFLLPDTAYVRTTGVEMLKMMGLLPPAIEWILPRTMHKIKNLSIVERPVQSGRIHDPLMMQLKKLVYKSFPAHEQTATKRIYISRENATHRRLLNEHEVQAVFFDYGFDILRYEKLSIKEQIQLSQSASIIASIHGAGLTNAFFMQPGAAVMEFRRDGIYQNQCFWHLADAMQLDYYYQFGKPDADRFIEGPNGCNLTLSTAVLEKNLDLFLSRQPIPVAN